MANSKGGMKMNGKKFKKFGGLVIIAGIITSVFVILHDSMGTSAIGTTVLINEVMYRPAGNDTNYEWIELYNPTDADINITGWKLSGTIGGDTILNGTINAKNFVIVAKNVTLFKERYPDVRCPIIKGEWSWLANNGDWINLTDENDTLIDSIYYPGGFEEDYSAERKNDEWEKCKIVGGTPGKENSILDTMPPEIKNVVANPSKQHIGGFVNITCDVIDNVGVAIVKVNISGPEGFIPINETMDKGSYYYNASYDIIGEYNFFIYAEDLVGNKNKSIMYNFEISDLNPPEIKDIVVSPSTQFVGGHVNISCNVTDESEIEEVKVNVTFPDGSSMEFSMNNNSRYYLNRTYDMEGNYAFKIIAKDVYGNENMTDGVFSIISPITLSLIYPVGGETVGGILPIKWNATSIDGKIKIKIEYRNETGEWKLIAENEENDGIYEWDTTHLEKEEKYKIRITAIDEDGNEKFNESDYFTITYLEVTPMTAYYNETKDIHVINTEGIVRLYRPDGSLYGQQDGAPGDVIFFNVRFDVIGSWYVDDSVKGRFYMKIYPIKLSVNITPAQTDFAKSGTESYVKIEGYVKDGEGNAIKGAKVEIWKPGKKAGIDENKIKEATTNDTGYFEFEMIRIADYGAGKYNVTARIGEFENANAFGYTMFTVNPILANITLSSNDAIGGFDIGKVVFNVVYPEDGSALLPNNNYNISVYKENKLYAWINTTDGSTGGNITFNIAGKLLNLTSNMWEEGSYVINVSVDITGDGIWEYVGEESYSIQPAPPVNIKILKPKKFDVLKPEENKQIIQLQIFGENINTFGTPEALKIGVNNENVTQRIKVEGDILYSPPREAYEYWQDGIWNITVFPTRGNGKIFINVTWPEKGEDNKTIDIVEGGYIWVEPLVVIVDTPTTIEVEVKDKTEQVPIYNANVTLVYEENIYGIGDKIASLNQANPQGKYIFENITSTRAATNIIVIANFDYGGMQYAYAKIRSQPAHDLNVTLTPDKVLAGGKTEYSINITKGGKPYDETFYFYILNETNLGKFHENPLELGELAINVTNNVDKISKGNYTLKDFILTEEGKYYLYVVTIDKKHDIKAGNEPSFEVTKAVITASPTMIVKKVDDNITVTFTIQWNNKLLNGTLILEGVFMNVTSGYNETYVEGKRLEVEVKNGTAIIHNMKVVNTSKDVTFKFIPKDGEEAEAEGNLGVTIPKIEIVEPVEKIAFLAEENLITIMVKHPLTNEGCKGLEVEVETPNGKTIAGKTDENGKLLFGIIPLQTGKIRIYVEKEFAGEIDIWIGLKIVMPSKITKGEEITILVTTRGGKPIEGATVKINEKTINVTDENGEIKYKPTEKGKIEVTAEKEGYYKDTKTVEVVSPPQTPGFEILSIAIAILMALFAWKRRK